MGPAAVVCCFWAVIIFEAQASLQQDRSRLLDTPARDYDGERRSDSECRPASPKADGEHSEQYHGGQVRGRMCRQPDLDVSIREWESPKLNKEQEGESEVALPHTVNQFEALERKGLGCSIVQLITNVFHWFYDAITYDFCRALTTETFADIGTGQRRPLLDQRSTKDELKKAHGSGRTLSLTDEPRRKRTSWGLWRRSRRPAKEDPREGILVSRFACFLRGMVYRDRRSTSIFWHHGADLCTTLCNSCECDFSENSTCGKELLRWKPKVGPRIFGTYKLMHETRILCSTAILLSVLRKKYVYKTVICMPLLILFLMLCKALLTLVQLRKYLENTRTPGAYTRDSSHPQSEDDDLRTAVEKPSFRNEAMRSAKKHQPKHLETSTRRLYDILQSLRTFYAFIDTSRSYHKHKMEAGLRDLLDQRMRDLKQR